MIECPTVPACEKVSPRQVDYASDLQDHTKRRIASLSGKIRCDDDEHQHTVVVLDMDGTLYPHDGPNGGFRGSTKERFLTNLHLDFIRSREPGLEPVQAKDIFAASLQHPIGPSVFLSDRYGCTRDEIFTSIWTHLHPKEFIDQQTVASAQRTLHDIRSRTCIMMLLTAAPRIWKDKVLSFLHIEEAVFDLVMTTEEFSSKDAVFHEILQIRPLVHGISVGDTESSDILPAKDAGFRTLHINGQHTLADIHHLLNTHE